MKSEIPEELTEYPPSCKLTYLVLVQTGPLTLQSISDKTLMPKRTARYALGRLVDEAELVEKRTESTDARKNVYNTI